MDKFKDLKAAKIKALVKSLEDEGFGYRLGAKIVPISLQAHEIPSTRLHAVDCSGMVEWCLWHAGVHDCPDGSVVIHDWLDNMGVPKAMGVLERNGIYVFVLPPLHGEPGHIGFILDGDTTWESYGHHGPGSRHWLDLAWRTRCVVYRLA